MAAVVRRDRVSGVSGRATGGDGDGRALWTTSRLARGFSWATIGLCGVGLALGTFMLAGVALGRAGDLDAGGVAMAMAIFGLAPLLTAWRMGLHPCIAVSADELIVTNPVRRIRLPLEEVADASPGYGGITIRLTNGRVVTAWAVQKSNLAKWSGKRVTRADDVAAAIRAQRG